MNNRNGLSRLWLLLLLGAALMAGCAGGGGGSDRGTQTSAKAITAYSLNGSTGTIDESAKTIAVTMPYGSDVTALVATSTTTGATVTAGSGTVAQTSGTTPNDFTAPVVYTVTAVDGSTATYTVTVTNAGNDASAITAFSLAGVTGQIDEATHNIAVTLPSGTNLTNLIATFATTGTGVTAGSAATAQASGTTANNFSAPLAYTVTAADGSSVIYTVTVLASDKAMTSFSINGAAGTIKEAVVPKSIAVTLPNGTNLVNLIATFTTNGTGVTAGSANLAQISGTTPNDFTTPLVYTVTAGDGSTATYTVAVTVNAGAGPTPVNLRTAGNFVILAKSAVSTTGTSKVVGDIGLSPSAASFITGFGLIADSTNNFATSPIVTGKIYATNYTAPTPTKMTTAVLDMQTAFTDAAGRTLPDFTELGAGNISGRTLVPGLYKWGTGVLVTSAGVTLSGGANDVWIFQIAKDLTVNNSAIITLSGGAQAKNIFWQVSGQATLGTAADFKGIILSKTMISLNSGTKMNGRALAQTAVTLNATAITAP